MQEFTEPRGSQEFSQLVPMPMHSQNFVKVRMGIWSFRGGVGGGRRHEGAFWVPTFAVHQSWTGLRTKVTVLAKMFKIALNLQHILLKSCKHDIIGCEVNVFIELEF